MQSFESVQRFPVLKLVPKIVEELRSLILILILRIREEQRRRRVKRGEVQDFGIRTRQGPMLSVALVIDGVTAMCQLSLRMAVEFKQPNRL